MSLRHVLVVAVIAAVLGFLVLGALRPGRKEPARVLVRWGVSDPSTAEMADALRHLKRRRVAYLVVFVAVSVLVTVVRIPVGVGGTADGPASTGAALPPMLLATLLLGLLLAEVSEWRRPSRSDRHLVAPAGLADIRPASPWSTAAFVALFGAAVGVASASLAGAEWARRLQPDPVPPPVAALLAGAAAGSVVWLAGRRPAVGEPRADKALRARVARIGVGVAMAILGALISTSTGPVGDTATLLGVVCWIATVNPAKGPRAARATV
jgi:hypothetical protein